ncbi:hypothetical protein WA538_000697 [Blastocystis sp. DL]
MFGRSFSGVRSVGGAPFTVAVYSDADRNAKHVKMADEAVYIGPSPSAQSYLRADKIVEACLVKQGADAVHPAFAETLEEEENHLLWTWQINSDEEVLKISHEIGYPVMIKASAGGGGKGMREVGYIKGAAPHRDQVLGDKYGNYCCVPRA